jgi:hypothetical protein
MKNYVGSTIPMTIQQRMEAQEFSWNTELSEDVFRCLLEAMADYHGRMKSKDKVLGLKLNDMNIQFHFGAYVTFLNQEETGADDGAWGLNYTFDETDFDEKNWEIHTFDEPEASVTFEDIAYTKAGIAFKFKNGEANDRASNASAQSILCLIMDCVSDYMRTNVTIDPELEFTNYLKFKAEISGNDVYIGITPSPLLKQFVKEDSSIGTIGEVEVQAAAYRTSYTNPVAFYGHYQYEEDPNKKTPANCPVSYVIGRRLMA